MSGNKLNFEDGPGYAVPFFLSCVCAQAYVAVRVLALWVLHRQLRLSGIRLKMIAAALPGCFAFLLMVRTMTSALNNSCAAFVPASYLIRGLIHTILLTIQVRALVVMRYVFFYMKAEKRQSLTFAIILSGISLPVLIFVILTWVYGVGQPLNGVCTLGGSIGALGISYWAWAGQAYEFLCMFANILTELFLYKSPMGLGSKLELRRATRLAMVLLVWDTFFRFGAIQKHYKNPDFLAFYGWFYATTYVYGSSVLFAFAFEFHRISFFELNFWNSRLYYLWLGYDHISTQEIDAYKKEKLDYKQKYRNLLHRLTISSNSNSVESSDKSINSNETRLRVSTFSRDSNSRPFTNSIVEIVSTTPQSPSRQLISGDIEQQILSGESEIQQDPVDEELQEDETQPVNNEQPEGDVQIGDQSSLPLQ